MCGTATICARWDQRLDLRGVLERRAQVRHAVDDERRHVRQRAARGAYGGDATGQPTQRLMLPLSSAVCTSNGLNVASPRLRATALACCARTVSGAARSQGNSASSQIVAANTVSLNSSSVACLRSQADDVRRARPRAGSAAPSRRGERTSARPAARRAASGCGRRRGRSRRGPRGRSTPRSARAAGGRQVAAQRPAREAAHAAGEVADDVGGDAAAARRRRTAARARGASRRTSCAAAGPRPGAARRSPGSATRRASGTARRSPARPSCRRRRRTARASRSRPRPAAPRCPRPSPRVVKKPRAGPSRAAQFWPTAVSDGPTNEHATGLEPPTPRGSNITRSRDVSPGASSRAKSPTNGFAAPPGATDEPDDGGARRVHRRDLADRRQPHGARRRRRCGPAGRRACRTAAPGWPGHGR